MTAPVRTNKNVTKPAEVTAGTPIRRPRRAYEKVAPCGQSRLLDLPPAAGSGHDCEGGRTARPRPSCPSPGLAAWRLVGRGRKPAARSTGGVPAGRKARPQRGPAALWGVTGAGEGEFYTRWATGQNVLAVTAASSELLGLCPRG